MKFIIKYWKSIFWIGASLYSLLSTPDNLQKKRIFQIEHLDKIIHFGIFCVMMILISYDIQRNNNIKNARANVFAACIAIFIAIVTELTQHYYIKGRSGDLVDLFADLIGIILGIAIISGAAKYLFSYRNP